MTAETPVAGGTRIGLRAGDTVWLTDAMVGTDPPAGAGLAPELALVLTRELRGPGVTTATALAAVGSVHGAVATEGWFVLGPVGAPAAGLDLSLEAVLVELDGAVHDSATGAAVDPAQALATAANALAADGQALPAGSIVLTGALTAPVAVPAGGLGCSFTHLGSIHLSA